MKKKFDIRRRVMTASVSNNRTSPRKKAYRIGSNAMGEGPIPAHSGRIIPQNKKKINGTDMSIFQQLENARKQKGVFVCKNHSTPGPCAGNGEHRKITPGKGEVPRAVCGKRRRSIEKDPSLETDRPNERGPSKVLPCPYCERKSPPRFDGEVLYRTREGLHKPEPG